MERAPRKRDKEASKQALMRAGLNVFATNGYDAATTKAIAAEAGLNEQLITRYFGGKAGLMLAILEQIVDEEAQGRNYPAAVDDLAAEIRQFMVHRHKRLLELQDILRAYFPMSLRDTSIRESLRPILLRQTSVLRERLMGLQNRGLLRTDADLDRLALTISGVSFHVSFLLRVNLDLADDDLDQHIEDFVAYMARGLAPLTT